MVKIKSKAPKSISLLLYVSVILIFVYLEIKKGHKILQGAIEIGKPDGGTRAVFVIIICKDVDVNDNGNEILKLDVKRQTEQAFVLMKSAALLTTKTLRFVAVVDSDDIYNDLVAKLEQWPEKFRRKIILEKRNVWFPESGDFKHIFPICVTERLFLQEVFPSEDAVIYLDTDFIFLTSPENLWKEFSYFNSNQLCGLAPCLSYYNKNLKYPYYGKTGLNAGLWMMNFTRMRNFPGGWIDTCVNIQTDYKGIIKLADQDIANIIFAKNSHFLYELGCQWNYREFLCNGNDTKCKAAESTGIFMLHGNLMRFHVDKNPKIKYFFKRFLTFDVEMPLEKLLKSIKVILNKIDILKMNKRNCPAMNEMLTKSLEATINGKHI